MKKLELEIKGGQKGTVRSATEEEVAFFFRNSPTVQTIYQYTDPSEILQYFDTTIGDWKENNPDIPDVAIVAYRPVVVDIGAVFIYWNDKASPPPPAHLLNEAVRKIGGIPFFGYLPSLGGETCTILCVSNVYLNPEELNEVLENLEYLPPGDEDSESEGLMTTKGL